MKAGRDVKPHIGICAVPLEGGKSGIGVYIIKIVKHISQREDIRLTIFGFESERNLLEIGNRVEFVRIPEIYKGLAAGLVWHLSILPLLALVHRLDVLFLPAGNRRMSLRPPLAPYRLLATVHDLAQFYMPQKYDRLRTMYVTKLLPAMWKQADALLSVSHSTKRDLVEKIGIDASKISVVWNGVEHENFRIMPKDEARRILLQHYALPESYILYVSRLEHPGKNHVGLLRAYARLRERRPDMKQHLLFCGSDWNGAEEVHAEIMRLNLRDYVHTTGFIEQNLLPYYYCAADLMAFPSLFEGFGIPLIEAMAAGLPVVSSDRASLPEVLGEVGLTFNPEDPHEMSVVLEKGLFDDEFRRRAVSEGPKRAAGFSWKISADETAEVLMGKQR